MACAVAHARLTALRACARSTLGSILLSWIDVGLHIAVGDSGQVLIARLSAAAEGAADFKVGDTVQVGWQTQNALILPDDSKT